MRNRRNHRPYKQSLPDRIFEIGLATFMVLFCLTILYPIWDMVVTSFSKGYESSALTFNAWPQTFSLDSYRYCLQDKDVYQAFLITVLRTVCGTALTIIMLTLVAYPVSKRDLPYRPAIVLFFVFPMFFSGGLIPTYMLIRNLGLIDNLLVYIIPGAFSAFSMLIFRNFLMAMDISMEESAYIDGANVLQMLFRIILPLSKPVVATLVLWTMVGHWNAWFDSLIYISSNSKIVIQLYLRRLMDNTALLSSDMQMFMALQEGGMEFSTRTVQAAITVIVITPIICVYPFLQKYFVHGIMIGAVKG